MAVVMTVIFLDKLNIAPTAIYTMDKAYVDFEALNRIDEESLFRNTSKGQYEV